MEVTPEPPVVLIVIEPPKETSPPPVKPDPVLMVIFELARLEFVMVPLAICDPVIVPFVIDTAPPVTVKLLEEKEAIPRVVLVAGTGKGIEVQARAPSPLF